MARFTRLHNTKRWTQSNPPISKLVLVLKGICLRVLPRVQSISSNPVSFISFLILSSCCWLRLAWCLLPSNHGFRILFKSNVAGPPLRLSPSPYRGEKAYTPQKFGKICWRERNLPVAPSHAAQVKRERAR
jgi:hypothetical protein